MSYQALARKWRPAQFKEVVGQSHVVTALSNALEQNRVHHAFLFTGTRGVGKTTLARIFAKALNCEKGVSALPCGKCSACLAVSQGRFVDLIEVDAASRTKVDDTRELLDNVQYAPTQGRYKVYLIDEVHMLSTHSFNALLKTLEEPPEHVKFLLATTDPQKLPVTVLSRCIQFSLNAIEPAAINAQLEMILTSENLAYDEAAISLLAKAANGSLRDGLSLLDQAIAYSDKSLSETSVRQMMGLVDDQVILVILDALAEKDVDGIMSSAAHLVLTAQDLKKALDDLLSYFHTLALYQFAPDAIGYKEVNEEEVARLSTQFSAQTLQLFYQIALKGKQDFALAPDPRTGFEMVLLRLMAFAPVQTSNGSNTPASATPAGPKRDQKTLGQKQEDNLPNHTVRANVPKNTGSLLEADQASMLVNDGAGGEPLENGLQNTELKKFLRPASSINRSDSNADHVINKVDEPKKASAQNSENIQTKVKIETMVEDIQAWSDVILRSGLSGVERQLVVHMMPREFNNGVLHLVLDSQYKNLQSSERIAQISAVLKQACDEQFKVHIELGEVVREETAAGVIAQRDRESLEKTRRSFKEDENVRTLVDLFGAEVDEASIISKD